MRLAGRDLHLLRVFDAVVRHRGYAGAQTELGVGVSTISTQITQLETRLGMTLCRRGRTGFSLTEQGEAVYRETRLLLAGTEDFATRIGALRGTLSGTLRIGLVDHVASDLAFPLPAAIGALQRRADADSLRFELSQGSPRTLQADVLSQRLHMAIGAFPHRVDGLESLGLHTETHHLYCAPGHPLWDAADPEATPALDPARITAQRSVGRSYWREDHEGLRDFPKTTAMAEGLEPQLIMILSGAFIGYMPDHAVTHLVASDRLRALRPDLFAYHCRFEALTLPDPGPTTRALLQEFTRLQDDHFDEHQT